MLQVLWPLQRCSCGPRSCPSRLTCRRIAQRSCRFQEALSSQKVGKAWKTHKVGSSQKVGKARSIQSLDTITHIEHDASVWHLLDAVSDAANMIAMYISLHRRHQARGYDHSEQLQQMQEAERSITRKARKPQGASSVSLTTASTDDHVHTKGDHVQRNLNLDVDVPLR